MFVAFFLLLWLVLDYRDDNTLKKGMPPGYYLECDDTGRYRACRDGLPLFCLLDRSSKAAAIRRAWDQYEYERQLAPVNWKKCE